jgi:hypothetical protein
MRQTTRAASDAGHGRQKNVAALHKKVVSSRSISCISTRSMRD